MIAALLVATGQEGENLVRLASLPSGASGWEIDQLVPWALEELGAPDLTDSDAAEIIARVLAQVYPPGNHPIVRRLAQLAEERAGFGDGLLTEAFRLSEYLDCDCHQGEGSDEFEERIRSMTPIRIDTQLAENLIGHLSGQGGHRCPPYS
jgi:hypothetical protein